MGAPSSTDHQPFRWSPNTNGGRTYSVGAFPSPGSCDIPWRKRWRRSGCTGDPGRRKVDARFFPKALGGWILCLIIKHVGDCGRLWDILGYSGIFWEIVGDCGRFGQFVDIHIVATMGMALSFLEFFTGGDLTRWARWDMCRTWGTVFWCWDLTGLMGKKVKKTRKKLEKIPGQSGRTKSFEEMSSMKSPDRKVSRECRIGSCRVLADLRFEDVKSLGQWIFVKKGSDLTEEF